MTTTPLAVEADRPREDVRAEPRRRRRRPPRRGRHRVRRARAERRRQDHDDQHARDPPQGRRRRGPRSSATTSAARRSRSARLIGVTGQYASVDETLSATENLVIFSRLLGLSRAESKRKSAELLERFGLTEAANRPLKNFSGGMRRRLDLAASLIAQPPLIFLDEPTTGLDPRTRAQMWDTIRELVATGSTVLLTTQYLDEADQLADRIAVIDHGRVVAEGTERRAQGLDRHRVAAAPARRRARDRDAARADRPHRARRRRRSSAPRARRLTAPMTDPDRVTDLLVSFRDAGISLAEMSVQKPTLDEVFLTITGSPTADDGRRQPTASSKGASHDHPHHPTASDRRPASHPARRRCGPASARPSRQSLTMAYRGLIKVRRTPEQLFDVTLHADPLHRDVHVHLRRRDRRQRARPTCRSSSPASSCRRTSRRRSSPACSCARTWTRACSTGSSRCRSPGSPRSPERCSPTRSATPSPRRSPS